MELKVNDYQLPGQILFNYEELKTALTEKVHFYETVVYTEGQVKEAKADRAQLNRLKKALNDERIRLEREYMKPFNDFKTKINEIISIINNPICMIDQQIKEFGQLQKEEKIEKIKELFLQKNFHEFVMFEQIFDDKWGNASTSMKSIESSLDDIHEQIEKDLATLRNLPEFDFESLEVYKTTLDINKAISEGHRLSEIQKRKAEHEAEQARQAVGVPAVGQVIASIDRQAFEKCMNPPEPEKQWVAFKAFLSEGDARELKTFFESRNIEFKPI